MYSRQFDWEKAEQETPRPEHPRPRLVRDGWVSLNGVWEFDSDRSRIGLHNNWYEGKRLPLRIVVPFAYQWPASGQNDKAVEEVVWYAKSFSVPDEWLHNDIDVLLHFGAVDYRCTVWLNGHEVGHNEGGHVPFSFNIQPYLREGKNRLTVRVEDSQDPFQPRGKQAIFGRARGIDYYCTTGIWQPVWLEPAPTIRVDDILVTPLLGSNCDDDVLKLRVLLHAPALGLYLKAQIIDDGQVVAEKECRAVNGSGEMLIPMPHCKRWHPDHPHLYDVRVELHGADGEVLDTVTTYAGMRSIETWKGQILLNGEPIYLKMVLDQGYWPSSGMTPPSDEAMQLDIELTKEYGYNGARKHQKVEDPRYLYWCDKLGLLVWAEMANSRAWSPSAEERFVAEWERAVRRDVSHPCIITWVPLNESWGVPRLEQDHPGQYAFVERLVALTRRLDSSRPCIDNDGWEHTDVCDIFAIHDYTPTGKELLERYRETLEGGPMVTKGWGDNPKSYFAKSASYRGQPVVLSEVGGFLHIPEEKTLEELDPLYNEYPTSTDPEDLVRKYRDLVLAIAKMPFVVGFCYTQLIDVEQEMNGVLTYDRQHKADPAAIRQVHEEMDKIRKELDQDPDLPEG
jgi:beta-galactosidase/beta-glucuronidase